MDRRDDALIKIATDALRTVQRHAANGRHNDLWQLAISRVNQTRSDIESDEELQMIRQPPPRAPRVRG